MNSPMIQRFADVRNSPRPLIQRSGTGAPYHQDLKAISSGRVWTPPGNSLDEDRQSGPSPTALSITGDPYNVDRDLWIAAREKFMQRSSSDSSNNSCPLSTDPRMYPYNLSPPQHRPRGPDHNRDTEVSAYGVPPSLAIDPASPIAIGIGSDGVDTRLKAHQLSLSAPSQSALESEGSGGDGRRGGIARSPVKAPTTPTARQMLKNITNGLDFRPKNSRRSFEAQSMQASSSSGGILSPRQRAGHGEIGVQAVGAGRRVDDPCGEISRRNGASLGCDEDDDEFLFTEKPALRKGASKSMVVLNDKDNYVYSDNNRRRRILSPNDNNIRPDIREVRWTSGIEEEGDHEVKIGRMVGDVASSGQAIVGRIKKSKSLSDKLWRVGRRGGGKSAPCSPEPLRKSRGDGLVASRSSWTRSSMNRRRPPTNIIQLTETERSALQSIALEQLRTLLPPDCTVVLPKTSSSRNSVKDLLRGLGSNAVPWDGILKEGNKKGKNLTFGIPISKCITNDELLGRESTTTTTSLKLETDNHDDLASSRWQRCFDEGRSLDALALSTDGSSSTSRNGINGWVEEKRTEATSYDAWSMDDKRPLKVPYIVKTCCDHLMKYGLQTTGLFRVSVARSRTSELKKEFDSCTRQVDLSNDPNSVHSAASLLKEFFRELPDPLLTRDLYPAFVATAGIKSHEAQVRSLRYLVSLLPVAHLDTLWTLLSFLSLVAKYSSDITDSRAGIQISGNKMDSTNLAMIFGPNLLHRSKATSGGKKFQLDSPDLLAQHAEVSTVIKLLIDSCETIFNIPQILYMQVLDVMIDRDTATAEGLIAMQRRLQLSDETLRTKVSGDTGLEFDADTSLSMTTSGSSVASDTNDVVTAYGCQSSDNRLVFLKQNSATDSYRSSTSYSSKNGHTNNQELQAQYRNRTNNESSRRDRTAPDHMLLDNGNIKCRSGDSVGSFEALSLSSSCSSQHLSSGQPCRVSSLAEPFPPSRFYSVISDIYDWPRPVTMNGDDNSLTDRNDRFDTIRNTTENRTVDNFYYDKISVSNCIVPASCAHSTTNGNSYSRTSGLPSSIHNLGSDHNDYYAENGRDLVGDGDYSDGHQDGSVLRRKTVNNNDFEYDDEQINSLQRFDAQTKTLTKTDRSSNRAAKTQTSSLRRAVTQIDRDGAAGDWQLERWKHWEAETRKRNTEAAEQQTLV